MVNHGEYTGPFKVGDEILGEYKVTGLLGVGGHAFVYECIEKYTEITWAVKVIPGVPGRSRDLLRRAKAEAQLLLQLNHPNVVRVTHARPVGESMVCIVMEKLRGLSLRDMMLHLKKLTVTETLLILRQVAEGVGAAHEMGVIHRDIKPENIFILPPKNLIKVLDFGIAKFTGVGFETTNKARVQGTPYYMSPEQLQGITVSARTDIYALGTLAFELITGKVPCLLGLENPDYHQMAQATITNVTPPLSSLVTNFGPRTEYVVQRSTIKDARQRFGSMEEVIQAIDEALIEQKVLYPRELAACRMVDEGLISAAKLAVEKAERGEDELEEVKRISIPVSKPVPRQSVPQRKVTLGMGSALIVPNPEPPPYAAVKPKPRVMAPTFEMERTPPPPPEPPAPEPPVPASLVVVPTPIVNVEAKTVQPTPAVSSSFDVNPTDNPVTTSVSMASRKQARMPMSFVITPIILGIIIAVAITWPDIQRARAAKLARAQLTPPPVATATLVPSVTVTPSVTLPTPVQSVLPPPVESIRPPVPPPRPTSSTHVLPRSRYIDPEKEELKRQADRLKLFDADIKKEATVKPKKSGTTVKP